MTNKVQKIREEVERLKSQLLRGACSSQIAMVTRCKEEAYDEVLTLLDSLQEEPIFKVGDTIQKKDNNSIRYSIINKTSDGYRALRGLSDTIVILFSEQDQWELAKEPISEELEEAAMQYAKLKHTDATLQKIVSWDFKAGAEWKKEQMMANAIDGEVLENYDGKVLEYDDSILDKKLSNCRALDKVKIIIIKEG